MKGIDGILKNFNIKKTFILFYIITKTLTNVKLTVGQLNSMGHCHETVCLQKKIFFSLEKF